MSRGRECTGRRHGATALILCVSVLSIFVMGGGFAGDVSDAQVSDLLEQADAQVKEGEYVDAVLKYVKIVDGYPDTQEKVKAFASLALLNDDFRAGLIGTDVLSEIEKAMPEFEAMRTANGKCVHAMLWVGKADYLDHTGDIAGATEARVKNLNNIVSAMEKDPSDPALYLLLNIVFREAKKLGIGVVRKTEETLEKFIADHEPGIGVLATRAIMMAHYEKTGNFNMRTVHAEQVAAAMDADYGREFLAAPYMHPFQKAGLIWAKGHAQMCLQKYEESMQTFGLLNADFAGGTPFQEWALFSIPRIIHMTHPDEPGVALAAYEQYLKTPPSDKDAWKTTERTYTNFARCEMGKIYEGLGDHEKAKAFYQAATYDTEHREVRELARQRLVDLEKSIASGEVTAAED